MDTIITQKQNVCLIFILSIYYLLRYNHFKCKKGMLYQYPFFCLIHVLSIMDCSTSMLDMSMDNNY